jgi:hypothetical protein
MSKWQPGLGVSPIRIGFSGSMPSCSPVNT